MSATHLDEELEVEGKGVRATDQDPLLVVNAEAVGPPDLSGCEVHMQHHDCTCLRHC